MSLRRHPVHIPRLEEEAMYQAVVITKPIAFLPAVGAPRVVFEA